MYAGPENFISANPHFCKSALSRYTQWDFIDLLARNGITWHEKALGQLFCDGKSGQIIALLRAEMERAGADLWLETSMIDLSHDGHQFTSILERNGKRTPVTARHLVVATGDKSIPKMGATGLAYDIARQFGHEVTETRPALVPFTFSDQRFAPISGTAAPARVANAQATFDEAVLFTHRGLSGPAYGENTRRALQVLFTHRGLSGPAILQISSYWQEGEAIIIDLDPDGTLLDTLRDQHQSSGRKHLSTELARHLPTRLVEHLSAHIPMPGESRLKFDSVRELDSGGFIR